MLSLEGIGVGYGRLEVLRDLDMTLTERRKVVVLGANGAGKTTLCRAISGIIPARRGRMRFGGADITTASPRQRVQMGIAQVPEGRQIFPRMTVLENLKLGAFVHGAPTAAALDEVYALFPILAERRHHEGGLLSGGEQQMLAIARAMLTRPRLLLLDEPSQGLAPLTVKLVGQAVNAIAAGGVSILLVEQNLSLAQSIGEDAHILESGRITKSGLVSDILSTEAIGKSYLAAS